MDDVSRSGISVGAISLILMLVVFMTGGGHCAEEAQWRDVLRRLIDGDKEVRKAAIESLTESQDGRVGDALEAFQLGQLYLCDGDLIYVEAFESTGSGLKTGRPFDPLTREPIEIAGNQVVAKADVESVGPRRPERRLIANAIRVLALYSGDREKRRAAVRKMGDARKAEFLDELRELLDRETDLEMKQDVIESVALIELAARSPDLSRDDKIKAAKTLGGLCSMRAVPVLEGLLQAMAKQVEAGEMVDERQETEFRAALDRIDSYQSKIRLVGYLFSGISLGSVLILMALGLSIIFGQMGVINMAHGELMMIGAYATYEMQQLFGHSMPGHPHNMFFVVALPVAFLSAAIIGFLMEIAVVRRLYGRPLETLLATWGVGLILIQAVRLRYGDNIGVNSPTWLVGSIEVIQDFNIPFNRCFIIALCALCVGVTHVLMNYTKPGLLVRATVQNREMAAALGVNTRRTDAFTFALGAGLAGVAGYALTLIGGVTPDMGQNYIVDSFLVVVTGGVGELAGAVLAGFGLGVLNKVFEPTTGAIWGKVLILAVVVAYIQWRPAGLFPPKGRLADV